jgi:glycopeptide antibiotics resistance protein
MFERFIKPVLIIIAVSMFVWILIWCIANIFPKKHGKKISYRAELILFLFYIYLISVMSLTIIPLPFTRFNFSRGGINLIPIVNTINDLKDTFSNHAIIPTDHSFQNLFGNIILFIPLGIFLPILSYRYRSIATVVICAFICSVSIETVQFIERQFEIYRFVDIDDVILNTLGAILGFVIINNLFLKHDKLPGRGIKNW